MKTISMDYSEYKSELQREFASGHKKGCAEIVAFYRLLNKKDFVVASSFFFDNISEDTKDLHKIVKEFGVDVDVFEKAIAEYYERT